MAKIVFALPPGLGDYAEICLEGVSAGGLPTRPRERFCISNRYLQLGAKPILIRLPFDDNKRHYASIRVTSGHLSASAAVSCPFGALPR